MVNSWLKFIQNGLRACLPCYCILCLRPSGRDIVLCEDCEDYLPWLPARCEYCALNSSCSPCGRCQRQRPAYAYLQALFDYAWPINHFITLFKYHSQLHFAKLLAHLLCQHLKPKIAIDCIVPIPLHPQRQQERGFNQTLELAKFLAHYLHLPLIRQQCLKLKATPAQSSLNARSRQAMLSAGYFHASEYFKGKQVLVIEDVVTTGTTIQAFTQALLQAGAQAVEVWSCCRTTLS